MPAKHPLSQLFDKMRDNDKTVLREYYADYKASIGGRIGEFPLESLDEFLVNLDGDENEKGGYFGSFDWRYFLIENNQSQVMPMVSVDYLHEIVFGCTRIVECVINDRFELSSQYTHSLRLRCQRETKYKDWLTVRMNLDGWDDLGDRLEILWGPDYRGRYDLYLFKGKIMEKCFSEIPKNHPLPTVDKRKEIESFDVEQGYRMIGVSI